jgi:DNA-binding response OmpR family regulator
MNQFRKNLIKVLRNTLNYLENQSVAADHNQVEDTNFLILGDVLVDFQAHQVSRDGTAISLTPSEYKILFTLASYKGDTIEYASLVELALGYQVDPLEAKELIKRHIFTLRQKIGPDFSTPRYILNVRGYGYRLVTGETLESVITG